MSDIDPKELARQRRKQAYQKAKQARKAYLAKQKEQGLNPEELARQQDLKDKARKFRKQAYQKVRERIKQEKRLKKKVEKDKKAEDMRLEKVRLSPEKLKLVTFDEDKKEFIPMNTPPPKLRIVNPDRHN